MPRRIGIYNTRNIN